MLKLISSKKLKKWQLMEKQYFEILHELHEMKQEERRRKSWESIRKIILVEPKRQEAREKAEKLGLKIINN